MATQKALQKVKKELIVMKLHSGQILKMTMLWRLSDYQEKQTQMQYIQFLYSYLLMDQAVK